MRVRIPSDARGNMPRCSFATVMSRDTWYFSAKSTGKMKAPEYGAGKDGIPPSGERAIKRCPLCNKRLQLRATYCVGGEFVGWMLPPHNIRETRKPGLTRKSTISGRGK